MRFALPAYIESLPEAEREAATCRFLVRQAALYYSPSGALRPLSIALGFNPNTLSNLDAISPRTAVRLEELLGKDLFPRHLFCPGVFEIA
jgi:hypothetical protein